MYQLITTPQKLALFGQDPTAALPWCGRAAGGPSARSWGISPFLIGNTSSIRVHFPASYVSLPECSWDIQNLWRKLLKIKVKFGCIFIYNMQNCEYIQQVLIKKSCSAESYHGFSIFLIPNVAYSLNQMHTSFFCIGAGIGGKSMAGHLLIFGTASPASEKTSQSFPESTSINLQNCVMLWTKMLPVAFFT